MAVHVLYLTVVIAVPVCMDLQVHDVKVRLISTTVCHILLPDNESFSVTFVCVLMCILPNEPPFTHGESEHGVSENR
jgi:hypothetical protein